MFETRNFLRFSFLFILIFTCGSKGAIAQVYTVSIVGSTTAVLGSSVTYTTQWKKDGKVTTTPPQWGDYEWIAVNGTPTYGSAHETTVTWSQLGAGQITLRYHTSQGTYTASKDVTVSCDGVPKPSVTVYVNGALAPNGSCGPAAFSVTANVMSGYSARWYSSLSATTPFATGVTYNTPVLTMDKTYYVTAYHPTYRCESSKLSVVLKVNSIPGQPIAKSVIIPEPQSLTLTASGPTDSEIIKWYEAESGKNLFHTGLSYETPVLSDPVTYYITAAHPTAGCESTPRKAVSVSFAPVGELTGPSETKIFDEEVYSFISDLPDGVVWSSDDGEIFFSQVIDTSPRTYKTMARWNTPGMKVITITSADGSIIHGEKTVTVACESPAPSFEVFVDKGTQGFVSAPDGSCGSAVFKVVLQHNDFIDNCKWYETATSATPLGEGLSYTTPLLNTTTTIYAVPFSTVSGCEGVRTPLTLKVNDPPSNTPIISGNVRFGAGTLTLRASGAAPGQLYHWYAADGSLSGTGDSYITPSISLTTNNYMSLRLVDGATTCAGSANPVDILIHPLPVITTNASYYVMDNTVLSTDLYDSYTWRNSNGAIVGTGRQFAPGYLDSYTVEVTKDEVSGTSLPFTLKSQTIGLNYNYISEYTLQKAHKTTDDLINLNSNEISQTISYFDGLGRPMQRVITGGSPRLTDIVHPIVFNKYGIDALKYLPFTAEFNGRYKDDIIDPSTGRYVGIAKTYDGTNPLVAGDSRPYSETVFDNSPLNRPIKEYGSGEAWSPAANNKYIEQGYFTNLHGTLLNQERVIAWRVTSSGTLERAPETAGFIEPGGYYSSRQLSIKCTKDEQGNEVREYTDKNGRVILKKVQVVVDAALNNDRQWAHTYYVHDDLGNLSFVLSPEASVAIASAEITPDAIVSNLNDFAFQYKYDTRQRMIAKKVPGADWVHMVYDNRDRLVLTQDGVQRSKRDDNLNIPAEWTFTKYDALNRPVLTGIYPDNLDRGQLQLVVDDFYTAAVTNADEWFELRGDAIHGYTNQSFPKVADENQYLTITFYDDDSYKTLIKDAADAVDGRFNYDPNELPGQYSYDLNGNSFPRVKGHVTATKVKVLGENGYLWSVNHYDDKYRVVQNTFTNALGNIDRITNTYDFVGKVTRTKTVHNVGLPAEQVVERSFDYDHAGRLLKIWHSVGAQAPVLLVLNEYNEIGQLVDKKLHNADPETAADASRVFKQSVDYRYNIRGWLESVNGTDATEPDDLFGMNLHYNTPSANGGIAQYNGNISEMVWKGPDAQTNSYGYYYDPMNRLLEAKYYNTTAPAKHGRFDEKISAYDLNGNIKFLQRNGMTGTDESSGIVTYGQMDDLTYTYQGNQLLKVSDGRTEIGGFIDGSNTDDDYGYDANGNMTKDKNKDITGEDIAKGTSLITYNFLNLPEKVVKHNGEYIKYIYDATGKKLSQEVYSATGQLVKKSDYAGEFFYENDTLRFINHEEGRVVMNGASPEYQYHLKDHLGNVRVTFTTKEETDSATATLEATNMTAEQSQFLRYENARKVYSPLFDKTNDSSASGTDGYAQRLSGGNYEKYGLAESMSVMPGDKISAEVYAKYIDPVETNRTPQLNELISQIVNGTAPAGTVIDGAGYSASTTSFPFASLAATNTEGSTETGPKAYLNWLVFDRDYNLIDGGYDRLSSKPRETGQNIAHERLFSPEITIEEAGYVYTFLSNEESAILEVYFDDFSVEHLKSPVVQMDDYYPFGLTFNSYKRENSVDQKYKFQGQEHIDDLNLGWDSFKWRNHQPDIGRFFNVDPLAEKYVYNSPYAFSENKVIVHRELEGLEAEYLFKEKIQKVLEPVKNAFEGKVEFFTPPAQVGKTAIEKINETPEPVPEKQQELHMAPTDTPSDMDGNLNPQYNKDGTAKGGKGGTEVITQTGGQTKVENADDPKSARIDSIRIGTVHKNVRNGKQDVYSKEVVKGRDTVEVYRFTIDLQTGEETKEMKKK